MRWIVLIIAGSILCLFQNGRLAAQEKTAIRKVVIDAGHGGKDPGALGKKVQEKRITLAVALRVGKLIAAAFPEVRVIYTRDKDLFVELYERAGIANRSKADLFISIHCNANPSSKLQGAETYVMGLHRSDANLDIAKKENAAILLEPDYSKNYNGFDPNSDESYITFSLFQDAFLEQSTEFAATIQHEMKNVAGMADRGVHQAGFLVLYKTTMPSVLVETGFLSNPEDEAYLMSEKGQDAIATAIFRAFRQFKSDMEKTGKPEKSEKFTSGQVPAQNTTPAVETKSDPVEPAGNQAVTPQPDKPADASISFAVQVWTSPNDIGTRAGKFSGLTDVQVYRHQGLYKYTTGREKTVDAALALLETIRKKGFTDAFVVAFDGKERITVPEARKRLLNGGKK